MPSLTTTLYGGAAMFVSAVSSGLLAYSVMSSQWAVSTTRVSSAIDLLHGWTTHTPTVVAANTSSTPSKFACIDAEVAMRIAANDVDHRWEFVIMALLAAILRQAFFSVPSAYTSGGFFDRLQQLMVLGVGAILTQCTILTLQVMQQLDKAFTSCGDMSLEHRGYTKGSGFFAMSISLFVFGTAALGTLSLGASNKVIAGPFALMLTMIAVVSIVFAENNLDYISLSDDLVRPTIPRVDSVVPGSTVTLPRFYGIRVSGDAYDSAACDCQERALNGIAYVAFAAVVMSLAAAVGNVALFGATTPKPVLSLHFIYASLLLAVYVGFPQAFLTRAKCEDYSVLADSYNVGDSYLRWFKTALVAEVVSFSLVLLRFLFGN